MKLHLLVRPDAAVDISSASRWYEEQLKGLGRKFINTIEKEFRSIQSRPARFSVVHKNIRRSLLKHFPYAIFFLHEGESIIILAVLHQARDPRRWKIRYGIH
jgi:toxin ParE1/3/4